MNGDIDVECVFTPGSGTVGQITVDDSLMAKHTQGTGNDVFSLEDGMLKANGIQGIYGLEEGNLYAYSNVTASAKVFTEIPNMVVNFQYNADGLRTKKVVTLLGKVTETDYILHGKLVTEMVVRKYEESDPTNITQTDTLHFFYDAQSRPAKVEYDGEMYTYLHNLQGDITGIVDAGGQTVVQYGYDAWGRPIVTEGTLTTELGVLNPFRYRAYVYDKETGLFYLVNRYYDSKYCRFLNADLLLSWKKRLMTHNVYAYCINMPSMNSDPTGRSIIGVLALGFMLVGLSLALTGCSIGLKSAINLNRETASSGSYNCYGNATGKQIKTDPTGYEAGMSTYDTFNLVKADVGERNITRHSSIRDEIGPDEYMVALKCGPYDYHFIVYDNGSIFNKQGITDLVDGCSIECIESDVWYPHFHTDEQLRKYGEILKEVKISYDDETIYFSIKRDWSESE